MFIITGVPFKRIVNYFLGKEGGIKYIPYNQTFRISVLFISGLYCNK